MVFHQSLSKGKLELKIAVDATNRLILGMSLQKIGDEVVNQASKGAGDCGIFVAVFEHLKLD